MVHVSAKRVYVCAKAEAVIPSDQIWPGLVKKNNVFMYFNTNLYYRIQNRLFLSQYNHANS